MMLMMMPAGGMMPPAMPLMMPPQMLAGANSPEAASPHAMQMPMTMDPNQYGGMSAARDAPGAYPQTPQAYQQNAASSSTFRDLCSPTYQSSAAYEQYVCDSMNADGDEFHFA